MIKSLKGNILTNKELEDLELIVISKDQLEDIQATYEENTELQNRIDKAINILELSAMNKGICTRPETDTIQSALNILKGGNNE